MTRTRLPLAARTPGTRIRTLAAAALLATVLLTTQACSSSSEHRLADKSDSADTASALTERPAGTARDADDSAGSTGEAAATDAGADTQKSTAVAPSIISTATISLRSDDVATARQDVQRVVDRFTGTIADENTESDKDGPNYVRIVLRVPAANFDNALVALADVAQVTSTNRASEDVTTQVIDVEARLRAQEASLRRVEALLARAESIKDIAWIEAQLTTRQGELDSLKQQRAFLADQTSLSTITVDVSRTHRAGEQPDGDGFWAGLRSGWTALGEGAGVVVHALGVAIPFLVPLAALYGLLRLLRRRSHRSVPTTE